mmetsp:Transcript_15548/g.26740  ORF Transcript_15548/g.26740 Transcript_15548/m.26740 type:complete len:224 (-) Transcript_15548:1115-1786(-)
MSISSSVHRGSTRFFKNGKKAIASLRTGCAQSCVGSFPLFQVELSYRHGNTPVLAEITVNSKSRHNVSGKLSNRHLELNELFQLFSDTRLQSQALAEMRAIPQSHLVVRPFWPTRKRNTNGGALPLGRGLNLYRTPRSAREEKPLLCDRAKGLVSTCVGTTLPPCIRKDAERATLPAERATFQRREPLEDSSAWGCSCEDETPELYSSVTCDWDRASTELTEL